MSGRGGCHEGERALLACAFAKPSSNTLFNTSRRMTLSHGISVMVPSRLSTLCWSRQHEKAPVRTDERRWMCTLCRSMKSGTVTSGGWPTGSVSSIGRAFAKCSRLMVFSSSRHQPLSYLSLIHI